MVESLLAVEGRVPMKISEVLERKGSSVATIDPDRPVRQAVTELARHGIGALVASTDGERVSGMISERDVVRSIDRLGSGALNEPVRKLMSSSVVTCAPGDTVDALASIMTEQRVRHVPVLEGGRLVGIVSIGDIVKSRLDELEADKDALVSYIGIR
jgi:CBS domain-containing protein